MQTLNEKLDVAAQYAVKFSNSMLENEWYLLMAILLVVILLGKMGMRN